MTQMYVGHFCSCYHLIFSSMYHLAMHNEGFLLEQDSKADQVCFENACLVYGLSE